MNTEEYDPVIQILNVLSDELDLSNSLETGSLYNKAYTILKDHSEQGIPSVIRAKHILLVNGFKYNPSSTKYPITLTENERPKPKERSGAWGKRYY